MMGISKQTNTAKNKKNNLVLKQIKKLWVQASKYKRELKISLGYIVVGIIWIALTDNLLHYIIGNQLVLDKVVRYKDYFLMLASGLAIFIILKRNLVMIKNIERKEKNINSKILDNASMITIMWDLDMNLFEFNKFAQEITGFSKEELAGKKWIDKIIPEEEREIIIDNFDKMKSNKLISKVKKQLICKNGERIDVLWNYSLINDDSKVILVSMGMDITKQEQVEEQLYYLAHYDELTGLPNKNLLNIELNGILSEKEDQEAKLALLYIDLDNFKHINDTLGHDSGDTFLKYVGNQLSTHINKPDIVARIGGDEFAIILTNVSSSEDITIKINEILDLFRKPFLVNGYEFFVSLSIGVAVFPEHGQDINTLLKNADVAMFKSKEYKNSQYTFFTTWMQNEMEDYVELDRELRYAINNKEFQLHYQPQIDLKTGFVTGVEALVRWIHPKKGLIPPDKFIPFAEESGIIDDITEWVLENAIKQKKEWEKQGYIPIKMGINLSSKCFHRNNLVEKVSGIIKREGISYEEVELEITETAAMDNIDNSIKVLNNMKELGIKIALDDFGIGFSSLNYLKKLPIDVLKMDRGFVNNVTNEKDDEAIANSIIQLAHKLDITVVAEGIETNEQLQFLSENNCDVGQGYLFSKPLPAQDVEKYFRHT
ncbi:EAL domain-containing protein [Sporosalibacterium faouarense]|uniref:EAL domain-containing protein n=1 Tax=Sporosalibacterium faouarense TaxID=516123 RepID=UPI00192C0582|nr:EAL domain-containing protein [Sporosalibacterium faouarense]